MRCGVSRMVMPKTVETHKREQHHRREMGRADHELFLPVRRLCASTAADHIQQPGHHDEARALIGRRHLHRIGAKTKRRG